jgi:hypothetical protein
MLGTRNALLLLDVINCTKSVSQEELFERSTPFEHLLQEQYAKDILSSDCPYRLADRIKLHKSTLQSGAISP